MRKDSFFQAQKRIDQAYVSKSEKLDLSFLELSTIPKNIGLLENLVELDISYNMLSILPEEFSLLENLETLYLSFNQFELIPDEILSLKNLKELNLSNNKLREVPNFISDLINLETFSVSRNLIKDFVVKEVRSCKLTAIDVSFNSLKIFPVDLCSFVELSELNLSGNHIGSLPENIKHLSNLEKLYLSDNEISLLPSGFFKLKSLVQLDLSNNRLICLPGELAHFQRLTYLNIGKNFLKEIPLDFANLDIPYFYIGSSPVRIPPSVKKDGLTSISAFMNEQLNDVDQIWESKVIIVGEPSVGKTSLALNLLNQDFNEEQNSTVGIDIHKLSIPYPLEPDIIMNLAIWDFGGQQLMHATHQFFLTDKALYVLVWNARSQASYGKLEDWLNIIQARDSKAPIIIVATHAEKWDATFKYVDLKNKFPNIKGTFAISNKEREKTRDSFLRLKNLIAYESSELPLMGLNWPKSWVEVANEIHKIQDKYTTPMNFKKFMRKCGVTKVNELLDQLHYLGYILYYRNNLRLNDYIVLKPEWLTQNVYRVLTKDGVPQGQALLTKELMDKLWHDVDEPVRKLFLNYMEVFDLSYVVDNDNDISLVVEKLSEDPMNYQELWNEKINQIELAIIYELSTSLPPGIPSWFIARSHRFSTKIHWRYGALFSCDKDFTHLGLIIAHNHERFLELRVRGPEPINFFAILRHGLELTLDRYPNLNAVIKVPCSCSPVCTYRFPLHILQKEKEQHKNNILCHDVGSNVNIMQLLYGFMPAMVEKPGQELAQYIHREIIKGNRIKKQDIEKDFPSLFICWPDDGNFNNTRIINRKLVFKLICEEPECWHIPEESGLYEAVILSEQRLKILKQISNVVNFVNHVSTILTTGAGLVLDDCQKRLKFMEALAKSLPDKPKSNYFENDNNFLRQILLRQDPHRQKIGLRKAITSEGHVYWVCNEHFDKYASQKTLSPLDF